jgi:hypothetical protein
MALLEIEGDELGHAGRHGRREERRNVGTTGPTLTMSIHSVKREHTHLAWDNSFAKPSSLLIKSVYILIGSSLS